MGFGLSGLSFGPSTGTAAASLITPRRQLSYTAVFSKMNTLQQVRFDIHIGGLISAILVMVAQWLEHLTGDQKVAGSIPVWGSETFF